MKVAPNSTVVTGVLRKFDPAADGFGGDVEIEVARNDSPNPDADFIKPQSGGVVRAFFGDQPEQGAGAAKLVGRRVRAHLTLLGGPGGDRAVVQLLKPK